MAKNDIRQLFKDEGWSLHCSTCGKDVFKDPRDYFMVKKEIWNEICNNDYINTTTVLCKSCAEKILGRKFKKSEYLDIPMNEINIQEAED